MTPDSPDAPGRPGYADVADPVTGEVRLCASLCATCIFHPGNQADLLPGRVAQMVRDARACAGHIPCHSTLDTPAPAICRGYADGPDRGASLTLRLGRALNTLIEITPPDHPVP
ncbi:hypothetical protein [Streptomyces synnematoformans]|uniref:Ferredoxin n=1 Tax=Streptomyces synnematoformans TaxID=415721 RepID=A0ABN2XGM4_9ACTN